MNNERAPNLPYVLYVVVLLNISHNGWPPSLSLKIAKALMEVHEHFQS